MTNPHNPKRALTPRLRFPEFREAGAWEIKPLNQVSPSIFDGTHQTPKYTERGVPFFSVENIVSGNKNKFISEQDHIAATRKNKPKLGDILITRIGIIGYSTIVDWDYEFSIYVTLAVIKKSLIADSYFLHCYFQSERYQKEILSKSLLNAAPCKINMDELRKTEVLFPKLPEQQKIAACLSSLDELITAETQKLEALKIHKKGLMQQLFPREGETVPRLRFPEFREAGEWEEKQLGQFGDVLMCKRIFAHETSDAGGVPFFKIGTLDGKPDAFISKELFEIYKAKYNFPRTGEVLITCSGTVGKCLPYDGKDAYYQDSNIVWIDNPTLKVSNEFLYAILLSVDWGSLNSTTITRIYGADLRGLLIKFPSEKKEQHRIAACLSSLDDLITAQRQKIDTLKRHKKGLMQQLFPKPE
ncbi:type I restriction-modification protein [Candidatus Nitrosoglobus terrae]|uniref:Type I restriction-modification protein n=1 Tax=Candidatus Nitrosoglobus terrae TaxID=1630141 RepID=A0A1Q2SKL5_9GAMM|nr:restriction endonuclease subunit S [Candidatus Nitrosoglobus terrae]BAW79660.1 type I restriction-modification protein [Candidatus Nitrosoglobus terrae]